MSWWIIRHGDGSQEQVCCAGHPAMEGAWAGGWNLEGHYRQFWRDGPDRLGKGLLYIDVPHGQTIEQMGHNPNFSWTEGNMFWRWRGPNGEIVETVSSELPPPAPGFSVVQELEREASLEFEDIGIDGTIYASLAKHQLKAITQIEARAAPVLMPAEPSWKQAQHEAKRQEVHFWSSGRRANLQENYPLAWAEVRRKWPEPSPLLDADRVGDVISSYRTAMLAAVEMTAPVEAWRVSAKEQVRMAETVDAVERALANAMAEWPQ